jgi:hypothetical protein
LRDSDNWQKGMPTQVYVKSLLRHVVTAWKIHRGYDCFDERDGHKISMIEASCGVLFNAQGIIRNCVDGAPEIADLVEDARSGRGRS